MVETRILADYEKIATGRERSLFAGDLDDHRADIGERLKGSRVAVVGAAGSIGFSTVRAILEFSPQTMALFDLDENGLVEVIRELRSTPDIRPPDELVELPIGLGSSEFARYFSDQEPFDFILNLSALKHVRSEKDVYSLIRMVDTNVLFLDDFVRTLPRPCRNFFSVSSDKAVNPGSLMGATKMVMERVLLSHADVQHYSSARFANVAFSNGSLPFGLLQRLQKRQPLAAPKDVRRYFISHEEAGHLCLLSSILGENGDVFFPKLEVLHEKTFPEIALELLSMLGYEAFECRTEDEARASIDELLPQNRWPCLFTSSDTSGEKPFEEFYGEEDSVDLNRFRHVGVVEQSVNGADTAATEEFIRFARAAKSRPDVSKTDYVAALKRVIPSLEHIHSEKSLDEKM